MYYAIKAVICTLFVSPELFIRYCAAADDLNSAHFYTIYLLHIAKPTKQTNFRITVLTIIFAIALSVSL